MRAVLAAAVAVAALLLVPTAPAAIAPLRWCGNDVAQRVPRDPPCLHVLMDLEMPHLDGIAATRRAGRIAR